MARDPSGNYTLPAGNPIAFGEKPASSSKYNAVQADIATELTDSLSRSGKGAMLAALDMGGFDIDDAGAVAADAVTIGGVSAGFLGVPSITSSGETAAVAVKGKFYKTTGGMTVPASTFAADDCFGIYDNSASAITVTQGSGLTLRLGGTTSTGNRTIAPRGFGVVLFISATEAVIFGQGVY